MQSPQWLLSTASTLPQIVTPVGRDQQHLVSVDPNGRVQWRVPLRGVASPMSWDTERIYVGSSNGTCLAIHRATGEVLWTRHHNTGMAMPCWSGLAVVVGDAEGGLAELDRDTGKVKRRAVVGRSLIAPVVGRQHLWLSHLDGEVVCARLNDHRPIWRRKLEAPLAGSVLGAVDVVVAPLRSGTVQVLAESDGAWLFRIEDCLPHIRPVIALGRIWLARSWTIGAYPLSGEADHHIPASGLRSMMIAGNSLTGRLLADDKDGLWTSRVSIPEARARLPVDGEPLARLRAENWDVLTLRNVDGKSVLNLIDSRASTVTWSTSLD